jgi:SAM-dependent methyltransferase
LTSLRQLREGWEEAAETDPLFNILTDPGREGGKWDEAAFFARGQRDVGELFAGLGQIGFEPRRGFALDFGCGVGRCTLALADLFETVCGVDISRRMVLLARRYDRNDRCIFRVNPGQKLRGFADDCIDFVYSQFVLQHMDADLQLGYVREFVRVLRPGGVAAFVLADSSTQVNDAPWRSMHSLPNAHERIKEIQNTLEMSLIDTSNGLFRVLRKP